jgi:hypothetical protein
MFKYRNGAHEPKWVYEDGLFLHEQGTTNRVSESSERIPLSLQATRTTKLSSTVSLVHAVTTNHKPRANYLDSVATTV